MKVLVTGGNGYLGWHVVNELLSKGHNVKILDLNLYDFHIRDDLDFIKGDVRNLDDVKKAVLGMDSIIHLAALSNDPICNLTSDLAIEINYNGTKNVANLSKEAGVKRLIFMSSCSVYGGQGINGLNENAKLEPLTIYAHTKVAAEIFLKKLADENFDVCLFRSATLYGYSKNMRFDLVANVIPVEAVIDKEIKLFGTGMQLRPLLHVNDAAKALVLAVENKENFNGEVFNLGFNEDNHTIGDLTSKIKNSLFPLINIKEFPGNVDSRSYAVNFDKFSNYFKIEEKKDIIHGVKEIKEAIESKEFSNPRDEKFIRVKYLLKKGFV
ncbi:SDR family oxidoreductase [Candidatus Woesearchaeota archaeon]|nr:SDR family oxidoreductase [Candidatus Woesearchaeota archaeon]